MQNIAYNIQDVLFYQLHIFGLPLSFFHTLLVSNQNKIKIVTEINLVKEELSHFKNAGDI